MMDIEIYDSIYPRGYKLLVGWLDDTAAAPHKPSIQIQIGNCVHDRKATYISSATAQRMIKHIQEILPHLIQCELDCLIKGE